MKERPFTRLKIIAGMLSVAAMMTLCVAGGYFIVELLPEMSDAAAMLVSLWFGFGFFAAVSWVMRFFFARNHINERHGPWDTILGAMERISQGDFSVLLSENDDEHFADLAKAVNDMARNLGTLETMRQDFISNVSHEIQSPLTSIGGFAALLKNDALPAGERRRYAGIIESESRRLSSLSDNLLKLSALGDNLLDKAEFRLDKQLAGIVLTLEPQWSAKNLTVEAELSGCVINGDEELLSQVWINLLVNAIKFTPENGVVRVSLKNNAVRIADTGAGISKDDLPHIFERFYKVDKARDRALGGNGLGLSLVKKITELHGGRISVDSEIGKGAAFEIFLPGLQFV
ncbi:MAG: HAMP domain-containing histidine kinase [Clostridiales Family XIII bacterium]|jgi:signal transduction histidine kinase|nr:HAMP domain-containing histidine kinase [Clostridiales Family XIII bacterium]